MATLARPLLQTYTAKYGGNWMIEKNTSSQIKDYVQIVYLWLQYLSANVKT